VTDVGVHHPLHPLDLVRTLAVEVVRVCVTSVRHHGIAKGAMTVKGCRAQLSVEILNTRTCRPGWRIRNRHFRVTAGHWQTEEIIERLSHAPTPAHGESLLGYGERTAAVYGVTTREILRHLELLVSRSDVYNRRCFGVTLTPAQRANLLAALPVTDAFLDLAVSTGYNHRGLDFKVKAMTNPTMAASAIAFDWATGSRSNACPGCLREAGIWPTRWRLLWSTVCRNHQGGLIEKCPDCASPLMALRSRLDIVPGLTSCHCGYDFCFAKVLSPSSTLLATQTLLDDAMDGHPVNFVGDRLDPRTFFVVFKTLAHLIRFTGYDLDGKCWAQHVSPPKQERLSNLTLDSVQAILERTGRILTLSPADAEAAVEALKHQGAQRSIGLGWRFQRAGLQRASVGRIGRILNTWTPSL
jgi:TniQ